MNLGKPLKILASTLTFFAIIVGCKDIYGVFTVDIPIELKGNKENVVFEPGVYNAEIDVGRKRVALKILKEQTRFQF